MKNIAILGSTGSIGKSALSIAKTHPDLFTISALAVDLIEQQVRQFHPKLVALYDQSAANLLRRRISDLKSVEVMSGAVGISAVAKIDEAELVLEAMVAFADLMTCSFLLDCFIISIKSFFLK